MGDAPVRAAARKAATSAPQLDPSEVFETRCSAGTEHLEPFLPGTNVAGSHVRDGGKRPICEAKRKRQVVVGSRCACRGDRLREHRGGRPAGQERAEVDEMAAFADEAAAAQGGVVNP